MNTNGNVINLIKTQHIKSLTQNHHQADQNSVFFAIVGQNVDGHQYLKEVLNKNSWAVAQASNKTAQALSPNPKLILVNNTRQALAEAACEFYQHPSKKFNIIAVTGTNGKTTTTYLIEHLLNSLQQPTALIGTIETRFKEQSQTSTHTTPDALNLQKLLAEFYSQGASNLAIEVSSHALDQHRTWGTQFKIALFSNLTQDHLDYHRTIEEYFLAKAKLFIDYNVEHRIINISSEYGQKLNQMCIQKKLTTFTFGNSGADLELVDFKMNQSGLLLKIQYQNQSYNITSNLIGEFNAHNILAALAAGIKMGFSLPQMQKAFSDIQVPGRLQKIKNAKSVLVVVDYAHTPDALAKALYTLKAITASNQKLFCVFGCGGDRDKSKRPLMAQAAENIADEIFVTSDNPRTENPDAILAEVMQGFKNPQAVHCVMNREEAIKKAIHKLKQNDTLLIAGKGHEKYQIIQSQTLHFDDVEIATKYLQPGFTQS